MRAAASTKLIVTWVIFIFQSLQVWSSNLHQLQSCRVEGDRLLAALDPSAFASSDNRRGDLQGTLSNVAPGDAGVALLSERQRQRGGRVRRAGQAQSETSLYLGHNLSQLCKLPPATAAQSDNRAQSCWPMNGSVIGAGRRWLGEWTHTVDAH